MNTQQCPTWCTEHMPDDEGDGPIHILRITAGDHEVSVEAWGSKPIEVVVPEVVELDARNTRALATALAHAADLAEAGRPEVTG